MRNVMIVGGAVCALMFASFGGLAVAADNSGAIALSTRLGSTTCATFEHLSKSHQERLVRHMNAAAPARSIAATGSAMTGNASSDSSNGQTPAAGRLEPSAITAACQASTGASTIQQAYAQFSTGAGISASH